MNCKGPPTYRTRTVRVDAEIKKRLDALAEIGDFKPRTPNAVLRHLLGLPPRRGITRRKRA